ncbi:50S ribosomal protein L10 [Candidatus Woesearchaeota archaeon]|nr:50S ribosomal protein L10 [Candidatus Woesearchaeota archaeon]
MIEMKAKTMGSKNARRPADYAAKAAVQKKKAVDALVKLFNAYSVVAVVNLESLPSAQLQRLRASLGGDLNIVVCKKSVMPGQTAPYDIVIPAGPTSFAPGPIISELASVGIKAGVEAGKIAVKVPSTIAREGEKIKPKVAEVMAKFNIQPMEIGLNLVAAFENGIMYDRKVLSVDPAAYVNELVSAAREARAVALAVGYPAAETIVLLVTKSAREARQVAREFGIMVPELAEEFVGKAGLEAAAIEGMIKFPAAANGAADRISLEFKEEIAAEKKRRESVSHGKAEELADELKKKGTLRE